MNILVFNKTHFVDVLEKRGHRVIVACTREEFTPNRTDGWSQLRSDLFFETHQSISEIIATLPKGFSPDRIVYFDESSAIFRVRGWEDISIPSLFYSVDAHVHAAWHGPMSGVFHSVLIAQPDYSAAYASYAASVSWLPLWAPEFPKGAQNRDIPVCFRGSLDSIQRAERVRFLDAVGKEIPLDAKSGPWQEAFPRAKIVLNESIGDDVNFRVFEAMGSGALLVTPRTGNGLTKLFKDGEHLVVYERGDVTGVVAKIRHLLNHEEDLIRIAGKGSALVREAHSASARGEAFAEILEGVVPSSRPFRYFAAAYHRLFAGRVRSFDKYPELAPLFLKEAESLLRKSLDTREGADPMLAFMIVECGTQLMAHDGGMGYEGLLKAAYEAWPDNLIYLYLIISLQHSRGLAAEVKEIATQLSDDWEAEVHRAIEIETTLRTTSPFRADEI